MAERVLYEDDQRRVVEAVSDVDPDTTGGWRSVRTEWKAGTFEANRTAIQDAARTALDTNRTYTALATPTAAQTTAQVKALSRQNNGLIRLLLGLLDGTT